MYVGGETGGETGGVATTRPREDMVGVNRVLAEFVKFKHGVYESCGTECFEGIMLEPCLLQPCFHVAGGLTEARERSRTTKTGKKIYIYIYIYV